jgi:hypothetical protein
MYCSMTAITVAGMAGIGLLLLSGGADAQSSGWNLVTPRICETYGTSSPDGSRVITNLIVWTDTYSFTVTDSLTISTLFKFCHDGSVFYGYYAGPSTWTMFYVTPGLK